MGDDAEEDLAPRGGVFANGAGVQAPGKDNATPRRTGSVEALVRMLCDRRRGQGSPRARRPRGLQDDPDTGAMRWARTRGRDAPATAEMGAAWRARREQRRDSTRSAG